MVEKTHSAGWWPQIYEPLRQMSEKVADWFAPRSEASAIADSYEIALELPGVKADDIDVSVDDNTLTVKGEKRFERQEQGRSFFFSEREYGAFQRSFRLPADAEADKVYAEFKDGVLHLRIAKSGPPPERKKKIEVRSA